RPLLGAWRAEIVAYCAQEGLAPRQDATNADVAHRRNYLRHELIPLLDRVQPGVARRLWESAAVFRDEEALLEAELAAVWPELVGDMGGTDGVGMRLDRFAALSPALQRRALRHAAGYVAVGGILRDITGAHIRAALALLGPQGRPGKRIYWPCGIVIRRG